jgi:hypothetical protein
MSVGEWDQRQLCPDGGCVGLIGPDGTCNVCGRVAPNWGDERTRGLVPSEDIAAANESDPADGDAGGDDDDEYEDDDAYEAGEAADDDVKDVEAVEATDGVADPVEWTERELCSDGACIGVIGDDGTCKVCGKPGMSGASTKPIPVITEPVITEPVITDPVITDADAPDAAANAPADVPDPPSPVAAANSADPEAKS